MTATLPMMHEPTVAQETDPDVVALGAWVDRGDREALQGVFERHGYAALRLALHRLGNQSDADDAVQHAFIGVMHGARSFRPEVGSARGYILAAVLNACAQQRRAEGSRRTREAVALAPERGPEDPDLREAVQEALAHLPEHQRQPVELRFLAGLEFPEIAAALGRSERTVRGQVTRGLERLRQICSRLGLATTTTALALALGALPTPASSAEAVAHCVAVAATGPRAVRASGRSALTVGAVSVLTITLLALLLALERGHPHHHAWTPLPLPGSVTASAGILAPSPASPGGSNGLRVRGGALLSWTIADDAITGKVPLAAVGAIRGVEDAQGPGTAWWLLPADQQTDRWTWGPVPRHGDTSRSTWTPARLLRAPRIGEDAYLVWVTPAMNQGAHQILYPTALVETPDGWKLTLDGLRILPTAFTGHLEALRSCFVFALGRMTRRASRLEVEVHWREMAVLTHLFPDTSRIERGATVVSARGPSEGADAGPATLLQLEPAQAADPADPQRWWQIPLSARPLLMTAGEAPPTVGGLCAPEDAMVRQAYQAAGHAPEAHAVYVLGPLLKPTDAMTVSSVRWQGATATVTVAVWEHRDASLPRHRPLLPVLLERPLGPRGPVTVDLVWEHFVAEDASGAFVLQAGRPACAGTTHLMVAAEAPAAASRLTASAP